MVGLSPEPLAVRPFSLAQGAPPRFACCGA